MSGTVTAGQSAMDIDKLEAYFESLEQYVHDAFNRIWVDISRYGPGLPPFPDVHLPALGDFQVPPPPPPPPPPKPTSWLDNSSAWVMNHPWKTVGLVIGVAGTGLLLAGYTTANTRRPRSHTARAQRIERRQVVVILGGDTPIALPLIQDLERKGYIVIASVSSPEACAPLESQCQGYVRALVLDPSEPATINAFLRSLTSTLSLRFPISSAGDPYVATSSQPYIHAIISLLTLSPQISVTPAPLEHVSFTDTYIPYLIAAQITPFRVIQCLLPLLRTSPRDRGNKSIIVCLPATEARVGIPFASVQSMAVASTLRGVEVLRREINLAAITDDSASMRNIQVVIVEIGALKHGNAPMTEGYSTGELFKVMEDWTASEKVSYGSAFAAIAHDAPVPESHCQSLMSLFKNGNRFGVPRQPTDVSVFVDRVVNIVSDGKFGPNLFGLGFLWLRIQRLIRGERFSVGAGATTYKIASRLPSIILDGLLNLPAVLISIRNRLLPTQPFKGVTAATPKPPTVKSSERDGSDHDEATSEWEAESNSSETAENSWVRLHQESGDP